MQIIQLRNINKTYNPGKENELQVLKDINLSIWEGEFVAIMGPSGSGKSTLMNLIGCLDVPTAGEYIFKGKTISSMSQPELAQIRSDEIGFIFQNFNLLGRASVLKNVELPLLYNKSKSNDSALRLLEKVGLLEKKNNKPNQLSGGQQQRVAVARALINKPSLILADEPTGNLDTKTGQEIMSLLSELNAQGNTIIMVTHDNNVAGYAKRVIQMSDGQIISEINKVAAENPTI
jgi:putative ABC transport system ATP-binding protein